MIKSRGQLRCFTKWCLLECDRKIAEYYNSLYSLEYFYKPKIQIPLWGAHISVIRGETILNPLLKEQLDGMEIEYYYIPEMKTNGVHFYLPVLCPILDDVRELFDLQSSPINYHLSVGNIANGTGYTQPEIYI